MVDITSSRHVLEERERWQDKRSFCGSHPLLASRAHTATKKEILLTIQFNWGSELKKSSLVIFPIECVSIVYQLV